MAQYSFLRNAPIAEALIDIRIRIREGFDVKLLSPLHETIKGQYPEKKTRYRREGKFKFKIGEAAPISLSSSETITGFAFTSVDGKQVIQARIDGFTFNRLRPYEKWESFRDEAFRLWKLYSALISPEITRVALRYINRFDIPTSPEPLRDFADYLTAAPIVPAELPQGVSSFLTRVVIPDPEIDAAARITQVLEQVVDPKLIPIILDIDTIRGKEKQETFSEEEAWQALEKLRDFKNKIFFACITEKAKELFQ